MSDPDLMIGVPKKWLYIYTMKCGSTALRDFLRSIGGKKIRYKGRREAKIHFAVVRNPYARAVSMWRYEMTGRFMAKNIRNHGLNFSDFEVFCEHGLRRNKYKSKNHRMAWNQKRWLDEFIIDKVIHLENLHQELCETIGPVSRIPVKNKTEGEHWSQVLTPKSIESINAWAKDDFELGNYKMLESE